ncbi:TnsA-like heteromeric transposase endonuclease subunit [Sinomonas sp.]|uniref:TnsA-like heteromeric transposase endonuclease subunit n=1 Tax=Sinomonas sp. TaxID=1914986 RepID=UPI003F7CE9CA
MNLTDAARVLVRFGDEVMDRPVSAGLADLVVESASPVRLFFSWPGKRNYEGSWWSSTVRAHVGFESLLERDFLMRADHDSAVVGIASQPLALLWPRGTDGVRGHVPDFFLRLRDGGGRVVDVRHPDRIGPAQRQFELTRRVCEEAGWGYEVFTGTAEPRASNLRWLSGYRQDRYAPDPAGVEAIMEAFGRPGTSMASGVRRAARALEADASAVQAQVLHLAHAGMLGVDLDEPLSTESLMAPAPQRADDVPLEAVS